MKDFMHVYLAGNDQSEVCDLLLMKRYTGDYSVTKALRDGGVCEVLYEGTRSKCFEYLSDKMKKYWDEQCAR
jgi:hypothetical protein